MALVSQSADDALWHARFGHLSYSYLQQELKGGLVDGLPAVGVSSSVCQSYLRGKQTRVSFPQEATHRASKPLELVHSDLCGRITSESLNDALYMIFITNDFSRYTWGIKPFLLLTIGESKWRSSLSTRSRPSILTEGLSKDFDCYLADHGIWRQLTTAHTLKPACCK